MDVRYQDAADLLGVSIDQVKSMALGRRDVSTPVAIALRYIGSDVRAVAGGDNWIFSAVHVADGDPSGYWPHTERPDGENPHRLARFVGGFDGNR